MCIAQTPMGPYVAHRQDREGDMRGWMILSLSPSGLSCHDLDRKERKKVAVIFLG